MDVQKYIVSGVGGLIVLAGGYFFLGGLLEGLIAGVLAFLIIFIAYSFVLPKNEGEERRKVLRKQRVNNEEEEFILN